ncbi:MAG TPA: hypothetical protein VG308_10090 [Stellaceae bacterium]|jgi:hypothetical protein|nr:hypothetical protein [Stellaceae bacterium]
MKNRRTFAMTELALLFAAVLMLAGCSGGVTGPCNDSDPVGPCATSHSQVRGGN